MSEGISFFGKVDRNPLTGAIKSEMPAWTFPVQLEELEESIASTERALARGDIVEAHLAETKEQLKNDKEKLEAIKESTPNLSSVDKDTVSKVHKQLAKEISGSMYTRSEMKDGTANAQEEARRMVTPIIDVTKDMAELCEANGIPITEKRISRNAAQKLYKLAGFALKENTNAELLRKDRVRGRR